MTYNKPALSFQEQAERLIGRGLIVTNKQELISKLGAVNYYRLSAYWRTFKIVDPQTSAETFAPNTKFETIWRLYNFDSQLRLIVLAAIELVDVAILRTRMVEQFTRQYGAIGYVERANFWAHFDKHPDWLSTIDEAVNKSREEPVEWFRANYPTDRHLPLWIAAEIMNLRQLVEMLSHLERGEQKLIAKQYGISEIVLVSWLHTLLYIRNVCAHHSRLWNRELPLKPKMPDYSNDPQWYRPITVSNNRVFSVIMILRYLTRRIDMQHNFREKFEELVAKYDDVPLSAMGFSDNWRDCPIWKL